MDCEINNFILTRYRREIWDNNPEQMKQVCQNMDMQKWHEIQENLYRQQIKQIIYEVVRRSLIVDQSLYYMFIIFSLFIYK